MNFFGTDGIRGTYGSTITDGTAFLLGKCLAQEHQGVIVVVGRDTRKSGDALFNSLLLGIYSGGGNCINLGILPTNSVGHFTRKLGADFGVMISASHNPPKDNGLKVFDRYGVKLCEPMQLKLSANMEILLATVPKGKVHEPVFYDIENIYCEDIMSKIKVNLHGINIALDCCYGASYRVGKTLFNLCGANVSAYCDFARGQLINVSCGATHTEFLQGKVEGTDCDLGFAFDGDCDRLAVFERDRLISPDRILYLYAKYMSECGLLNNNIVVGTVLTNGGVARALKKLGLTLSRSDVGDTNVFIKMMELSSNLGGENSGHYLL
ncbi:MAG: phosphoglucosamine mutase, partial [Clostridia bacterium]